ncbi:MAG TPA: hypothetical protein DGT21_07690 [Armatimonadetes bacterium]|nr:hypothetical protein [Armatimonadota bacterium]
MCMAQAPADFNPEPFTPPGPNIALNKPYTLEPAPNYGDCSLDPDRKLLTDGEYTTGYFWVQKTTVGWVRSGAVVITFDLGQIEPIAGVSYSTAAGVAGVNWPMSALIMVSDDGQQWTALGDLITLSNRRGAPPLTPYRLHRFATDELQARGRYLALIVDCPPYLVVDEIEVYRGQDAWLNAAPKGRPTPLAPAEYHRVQQVLLSVQARLYTDLDDILKRLGDAAVDDAERRELQTRAEALREEIDVWDHVPDDFQTILPLNELHARVYALQAPVLRAQGFGGLTAWAGHRYDTLQPLDCPTQPPAEPPTLSVRMMRDEHRADVINLTNPMDKPVTATVTATGLGAYTPALKLREVLCTDTRERIPISSAILPGQPAEQGLQITIPAGTTRQVWLHFDTRGVAAGDARAQVEIRSGNAGADIVVPLRLHVADLVMPPEFSIAIGGWDETNNKGGYQVTAENMTEFIANLREHGVNMPWSNPQVMPTPGEYDAEGNMTAPPDFTAWDQWVDRWQGARCWGLFPNVRDTFAGEQMGTELFNKKVGQWATAWVEHAAEQGIAPNQIMILLVDEPSRDEQDQRIIAWARALRAAQPELFIWNDPVHAEPDKVDPEFYELSDVLCPHAPRFLGEKPAYRDFYVAQRDAGRELWFYSCSGPSKLLDPAAYYRGQFWLNLGYGGKGSCYWAFGDESGFSWNAYNQARTVYSPLFLSPTTVTDAKQMEAIREGAEDYEYFMMLQARVEELEAAGVSGEAIAAARTLLATAPNRALDIMGPNRQPWMVPKDREVMDRLRLQALGMLERLSKP